LEVAMALRSRRSDPSIGDAVTAENLLVLVLVIIIVILVGIISVWYRRAHREELRLKRLRKRRGRADGRYQEKIRQAEERIRRSKG
jgi:uncharacterized membrane protein YqiK